MIRESLTREFGTRARGRTARSCPFWSYCCIAMNRRASALS